MEAQWIADRATLRALAQAHPDWGPKELAEAVGRCLSWAKKWLKRFSQAPADDQDVLRSRSCAHHTPYRKVPQAVVQRILEIREQPPENLHRTPGPRAILYYLRRDQALAEVGTFLPRSSCTVWRILRRCGCILDTPVRRRRPLELAEPMTNIELDFTDVSSVPPEPLGKKQHGVESFNAIDAGTSTWLFTQVRTDFNAETALLAVIEVFSRYGCPKHVTFDRDSRWIGAQQMRLFPSAFVRMLLCLGITPRICPPRRPDKKPFVERLHRTLQEECLLLLHPQTVEAAQEVSEQFRQHYNQERPHQGKACGNVPPQTAFPTLPTLPPLPERINPDRWLSRVRGRAYARKVNKDGRVIIDDEYYYVKQALAGQNVVLIVNAEEQVFEVWWKSRLVRKLPIRGLVGHELTWQEYVSFITEQARSQERQAALRRPHMKQLPLGW